MPTAPEMALATLVQAFKPKDARLELLKALGPYTGCAECEGQIGWRNRLDVPRTAERCPCHVRHQQQLAQLGVGAEPLALATAPDWTEHV